MGSCVSAYRNSSAIPPSPIKPTTVTIDDHPPSAVLGWSPPRSTRSFDAKPLLLGRKAKTATTNANLYRVTISRHTKRGTKEDAFFDSKPWLDSDCEDDFYSVKGDFTPSRGNTPVHHSFSVGSGGQFVKAPLEQVGSDPSTNDEPSPGSQKKKNLGQLFSDSTRNEGGDAFGNGVSEGNPVAMTKPNILGNLGSESVHSTETTPNGDSKLEKEKLVRSSLRCLPRLTYCGNFCVKD